MGRQIEGRRDNVLLVAAAAVVCQVLALVVSPVAYRAELPSAWAAKLPTIHAHAERFRLAALLGFGWALLTLVFVCLLVARPAARDAGADGGRTLALVSVALAVVGTTLASASTLVAAALTEPDFSVVPAGADALDWLTGAVWLLGTGARLPLALAMGGVTVLVGRRFGVATGSVMVAAVVFLVGLTVGLSLVGHHAHETAVTRVGGPLLGISSLAISVWMITLAWLLRPDASA